MPATDRVRRPHRNVCVALVAAWVLAACGSTTDEGDVGTTVPDAVVAASAAFAPVDSALIYGTDTAISPSGGARLAPDGSGWCLETTDGDEPVCLGADAQESASLGVAWRGDERAVAVTDTANGHTSVIDFAAGTVVETGHDQHRVYDWSPDGDRLIGATIESADELSLLDPTTFDAEPLAERAIPQIPGIRWVAGDVIWVSDGSGPGLWVVDAASGEWTSIDGGLGEQEIVATSADGLLAVTLDDDVTHGVGGPDDPGVLLFDADGRRSAGVTGPTGGEPDWVQISADGTALLALWEDDASSNVLATATLDRDSLAVGEWTELGRWTFDDVERPAAFVSNGQLRWDGGDTAWIVTEAGGLLEVTLTP
ncbi:MAG: hypothetical protein S0880_10055 [Actinomycetota bacterium]|nr:hypothetical protein [Actinomycetota bacterium]